VLNSKNIGREEFVIMIAMALQKGPMDKNLEWIIRKAML
jgi:hypothetical protein